MALGDKGKLNNQLADFIWWEYGQNLRVDEALAEGGRAHYRAENVAREVAALAERTDRLVLLFLTAMSLLQEKAGITDEEFLARAKEIDLSDGVEDGKVTPKVTKCPECGAAMSRRYNKCLWCGHRGPDQTPIEKVL